MAELFAKADIGGFPFNSINGDRVYDATTWREYFDRIVASGIYPSPEGQFLVTPTEGMTVRVAPGRCYLKGVSANCDAVELTLPLCHATLHRVDRVVVRLDLQERSVYVGVKQGLAASTPEPPALERSGDLYELALADIAVNAGTLTLTSDMIADRRADKTLCGFVHGAIASVDEDTLPSYIRGGVTYVADVYGGTATAYTATVGSLGSQIPDLTQIRIIPADNCGTAPSLSVNGGPPLPIRRMDNTALSPSDLHAGVPVDLLYYNNVYFFKSAGVFRYASGSYTISTDSKLGDISFTFSSLQFRPVYIVIEVTNQLSERGQYQDNVYLTPRGAEYCFKESRVYISKGRHNEKYFNALGIFDCTFETTDRGFTWKLPILSIQSTKSPTQYVYYRFLNGTNMIWRAVGV